MATYFVRNGGSGANSGLTWALAKATLTEALGVATLNGDIIAIEYNNIPTDDAEVGTDRTYTALANIIIVASTNSGTDTITPTVMDTTVSWIGHSTTNRSVTIAGPYSVFLYGLGFRMAGAANDHFLLNVDGGVRHCEQCSFWVGTSATSSTVRLGGPGSAAANSHTRLNKCVFRFSNAGHGLNPGGSCMVEMTDCSIHSSTPALTSLFKASDGSLVKLTAESCDFTNAGASTTIVNTGAVDGQRTFSFSNCNIGATASWFAAQTPANLASSELWVFNSGGGDTHYEFAYYNGAGSVTATTAVVANGAKFDGTNAVGWKIDTTSACNEYHPFETPWIEVYHSGTTGITPSVEICRSGSTTAYKDSEVWGEFCYQGSTSSPLGLMVTDRAAFFSAGVAQDTGALTGTEWVGEAVGNSWFGKLNPASPITPTDIGTLRVRVCVGVASISDLHVDPYIRVA